MRRERGARNQIIMPAWSADPKVNAQVLDLFAYLLARVDGKLRPGEPRQRVASGHWFCALCRRRCGLRSPAFRSRSRRSRRWTGQRWCLQGARANEDHIPGCRRHRHWVEAPGRNWGQRTLLNGGLFQGLKELLLGRAKLQEDDVR